jgi:HlyD family secretion protein
LTRNDACRSAWLAAIAALLGFAGCGQVTAVEDRPAPPRRLAAAPETATPRVIRATGIIQAVNSSTVMVPQISDTRGNVTLVRLIPSGTAVKPGDPLAEFDRTKQLDNAREAQAKFDNLRHQYEQREAQHRAEAEKRASELQQAEADFLKAQIELRKGPILSAIDRQKNQVKLEAAQAHVESLKRSDRLHDTADAADLRILKLQRDRQKIALDRAQTNADKLLVRATQAGMVARENVWRGNSYGPAQEGDQLWPGQPLLQIFDPSRMQVQVSVGEPDGAALAPGTEAVVRPDAYPDLVFKARFESASPVAAGGMESLIKNFIAIFRLDGTDPRMLPDLSAAVDIRLDHPSEARR